MTSSPENSAVSLMNAIHEPGRCWSLVDEGFFHRTRDSTSHHQDAWLGVNATPTTRLSRE